MRCETRASSIISCSNSRSHASVRHRRLLLLELLGALLEARRLAIERRHLGIRVHLARASRSRYVARASAPSVPVLVDGLDADAIAGVVEQRAFGRQQPLQLVVTGHAPGGVDEQLPHRHAAVLVQIGGRIVQRRQELRRKDRVVALRRRIGGRDDDVAARGEVGRGTESWRRWC